MLKRLFHDHPAKAGESYFEHLAFAFGFSWRLFRAGLAAFVHGILPACCETTASSEVLAMNDEIRARRALVDQGAIACGRTLVIAAFNTHAQDRRY